MICISANTAIPASASTPSSPDGVPLKIRSKFLATVLSESILNLPSSLCAVIPTKFALLMSLMTSANVDPVISTSKLSNRIVSPGVNVGLTVSPVLVPYNLPLLWNLNTAPEL